MEGGEGAARRASSPPTQESPQESTPHVADTTAYFHRPSGRGDVYLSPASVRERDVGQLHHRWERLGLWQVLGNRVGVMAALDFPNTPTVGQQFAAPNGALYSWD